MVKHKKRYNRFFLVGYVLLIFLIVICIISIVKGDYNWGDEYIKAKGDNWVVITQGSREQKYLFFFNPPVTGIGVFNKKSVKKIQGNTFYIEDLWAARELVTGKVKEEAFSYLINCDTLESGWGADFMSNINKNNIELNKVAWLKKGDEHWSEESVNNYQTICKTILAHDQLKPVIDSQNELVNKYIEVTLPEDKDVVFYYSMSPLGILDPIYDPTLIKKPDDLINTLYGYYSRRFGISIEKASVDAEFPLEHAATFNEFDYYNVNKEKLNNIASLVENNAELQILGVWDGSNIYRVNNYFGDTKRNIRWIIQPGKFSFNYILDISNDSFESQQNISEKTKYDEILKQMSKMGVQSIYKCDGKIIFIMFAVSDNAFGYVYNSSKSNDINCGLLSGRFDILNDQIINKEWRYWVAN